MNKDTQLPEVKLSEMDGNAFAILGAVEKAITNFYADAEEGKRIADEFDAEATSGDYDHLLQTCHKYCDVH